MIISNDNGQLTTSISHKPAAEPSVSTYTSGHPCPIRRNIPYTGLLPAARACSNAHDFNSEHIRISMALPLNEYPPAFILMHFHRFFALNSTMPVFKQLYAQFYHRLHQKRLHRRIRHEKNSRTCPLRSTILEVWRRCKPWSSSIIYARYKFELGPQLQLQKEYRAWWHAYFVQTETNAVHIKVRFVIQSNQTTEQFLVHKKPPREMLR